MILFSSSKVDLSSDVWILPFWEGPIAAADLSSLKIEEPLRDFKGKEGELLLYYDEGRRLMFLGLGKKDEASVEGLRRAYSCAVHLSRTKQFKSIDLLFPRCQDKEKFLLGIAEGVLLTNYNFTYQSREENPKPLLQKVTIIGIKKDLSQIETIINGVYFVRDLVNSNADDKIEQVVNLAKKLHPKIKTTIFDKKHIQAEKMGLILAVNRSSSKDPYLVQASYRGNPKGKEHIVLVGKGITYDTGGLSLKPTSSMLSMKCDMAGAATVLGAVRTAAHLGLKVNVTAIIPLTENCIGSKSYKLGDVYRSYSGMTVEINNTDAEGRLVLADALSFAVKNLKPSCIIDLATLTGACVIALGEQISGLFSNDDQLAEKLLKASSSSDELIWQLPIHKAYKKRLKSELADLQNSGGREAGSITAALFLQEFVGKVPWAHIDIAGPSYLDQPEYYNPSKGTGHGLRLLIEFLRSL